MKKQSVFMFLPFLLFLSLTLPLNAAFGAQPAQEAPQVTFPAPESQQVQTYLGLKTAEPFTISKVNGKLVVVEFFSAVCPQCLANAPVVNKLYKALQEDPGLKGVKLMAVAIGNEKPQVEAYRKNFKVAYPIFLDEAFAISAAMDGVETPTTVVFSTATGKVLASHQGVIKDFDGYLKNLKALYKNQ